MKKFLCIVVILLIVAAVAFVIWLHNAPTRSYASQWIERAAMSTARSEITVAVADEHLYVAGGIGARGTLDSFERYSPTADQWLSLPPLPAARHHVAMAALSGKIYAVGGFRNLRFEAAAESWVYDIDSQQWQSIAPMPAPRGEHALLAVKQQLYVIAGSGPHSQQVWRYTPASDQWESIGDPMPTERNSTAAVADGPYIYVTGGRLGSNNDMTVVERFDTRDGTWTTLTPLPRARAGHAGALVDGLLYIYGGEDLANAEVFGEVFAYDIETDTWTNHGALPEGRHGLAGAAINRSLYAIGGGRRSGLRTPFALGKAIYSMDLSAPRNP